MKIAIVRQRYTHFGGAERFVARALGALASQGVSVTLITRKWSDAASNQAVKICNPFFLGRLWRDWSFARGVQQLIASGEFDLVQSHERIPGCAVFRAGDGVHASWLALRGETQSVVQRWATCLSPWHRYTLAAEKAMFAHAALRAVICNSAMVRAQIVEHYRVPEAKIHVIHNGVDTAQFTPQLRDEHRTAMRLKLGIAEETPVVLFLGSGFERKGLPQLLRAFTLLQDKSAHLVVVGKDRKLRRMQKLAADLGVAARVHFAGGQEDVRPWYGMADVFALPTLYDPFPNVVLEALACGLPVLTSNQCGAAEIVAGTAFGRVCGPLDTQGIAEGLDFFLQHPDNKRAQMARQQSLQFAKDDMSRKLINLYAELLPATDRTP